jgi:hypothetical protein
VRLVVVAGLFIQTFCHEQTLFVTTTPLVGASQVPTSAEAEADGVERCAHQGKEANPGRRSLLVSESIPSAPRPHGHLHTATKDLADSGVSLLRGSRMSHDPRSRIVGVAEVGHGPTTVDGEVAQFRAETRTVANNVT